MATWRDFELSRPRLAERGREILYNFGVPLGYLATVRKDGGPRVHPFCPILHAGKLYGRIGSSPKQRDLIRDGRCATHSFPLPDRADEFSSSAAESSVTTPSSRARFAPPTSRPGVAPTGASVCSNSRSKEF
jgi:hypothetical protein